MKAISKITLKDSENHFQHQEGAILSEETLKAIFGGTGTAPPNSCFFEALAYLSNYFNDNPACFSSDDYFTDFQHTFSSGMYFDSSGAFLGIGAGIALEYANMYFDTTPLSSAGDIDSYLGSNPNGRVMAIVNIEAMSSGFGENGSSSSGTLAHAIIIRGKLPDGNFDATDASTGQSLSVPPENINPAFLVGASGEKPM